MGIDMVSDLIPLHILELCHFSGNYIEWKYHFPESLKCLFIYSVYINICVFIYIFVSLRKA